MNLELFIARRIARETGGRGLMVRIAEVSVAIGLAAMILTLAVIMGFKREITRRIEGFVSHVQVTDLRNLATEAALPISRTDNLEQLLRTTEGVQAVYPYALREGIVKTSDAVQGMLLKGVDSTYDLSFFADFLVEGTLPRLGSPARTKDVLISRTAADRLLRGVGDPIEMLFIGSDMEPRRDRFRIAGIYATGMDEMDASVLLTDLRNVQRLSFPQSDNVTGYEIWGRSAAEAPELARRLSRTLLYTDLPEARNLVAAGMQEQYAHIFDWLRAHDVNAAVVIVIMLAVAFFNMASALLILVLERMRMIGLLKALGMRDGPLQRVFLWRTFFILLRGLAWGNAAGLALCLLQQHFHVLKLNAEGYMLSEVPVALHWGWWLALNAGTAAIILLLTILPARAAATVKPSETIHYE